MRRPRRARRRRRANPEATLHKAVASYLRLALRPPVLWSTFPAGGGGRIRGAQLKAMGLAPGMPDLLVFAPSGVLGIELKADKGKQSPEQKEVERAFAALGYRYELCRSIDAVECALAEMRVPLHAVPMGAGLRRVAA